MQLQKARVGGVRGILENIFKNPSLDLNKHKTEVNDLVGYRDSYFNLFMKKYWKIDYIIK